MSRIENPAKKFQSTPSVGRATTNLWCLPPESVISIHALRGEGDQVSRRREEINKIFQSTPSVGRATLGISDDGEALGISIHALRGEGDIY